MSLEPMNIFKLYGVNAIRLRKNIFIMLGQKNLTEIPLLKHC